MTVSVDIGFIIRIVICLWAIAVIFIHGYTEIVRLATVTEARQRLHELNGRYDLTSSKDTTAFLWMGFALMILSAIGICVVIYGVIKLILRLF